MNKSQKKILKFLTKQDSSKFISIKLISEKIKLSSTLVGSECYKLREAGLVESSQAEIGAPIDYRITVKGETEFENSSSKSSYSSKTILKIVVILIGLLGGSYYAITINVGNNTINNFPVSESNSNQEKDSPVIPYLDVWKTFNENRPYTLAWTNCGFGTFVESNHTNWDFSMKPIMLNKNNEPALIPFNISYSFHFKGLIDNQWRELPNALTETTQKLTLDPKENPWIKFSGMTNAIEDARNINVTKIQIIKTKSAFVPYAESLDDNVLDNYEYDREDYIVTQIEYNGNSDTWEKNSPKDSICSNLYGE